MNPPKQLYCEGNIELLKSNIISIIGSRACSENGIKLTKKFAKELVYQQMTIASGMAIGIDSIAHKTTLQEKGKTIAVLPSGLHYIYPFQNIELYKQIIENDGLVITEYESKQKATSEKFLERNRIVSGLAIGILVIEAAYRSGTSVTAKFAKQQGKLIFAVPHEIEDIHGKGTNRLIKNGAKIVTNVKDIISQFPFIEYREIPKTKEKCKKECIHPKCKEIYKIITEQPISLNEIYKKSNKSISEINNILLILELEGHIKKVVGGYKCILEEK